MTYDFTTSIVDDPVDAVGYALIWLAALLSLP